MNKRSLSEELTRVLIACLVTAALAVPAIILDMPALNVLPFAGAAAFTAIFGTACGAVGGVVTAVCSAYTLSEGHSFFRYSTGGIFGLIAIVFAVTVIVVFVGRLKRMNEEYAARLAEAERDPAGPEPRSASGESGAAPGTGE